MWPSNSFRAAARSSTSLGGAAFGGQEVLRMANQAFAPASVNCGRRLLAVAMLSAVFDACDVIACGSVPIVKPCQLEGGGHRATAASLGMVMSLHTWRSGPVL